MVINVSPQPSEVPPAIRPGTQPDPQAPMPVVPVAPMWQQTGLIKGLWPLGEKALAKIGWTQTAMVWMEDHPRVAESIEIILDFAQIPCPGAGQAMTGIGTAFLTLLMFAVKIPTTA